jgi:methanogenic corrinoid protein MtbC1/DNA-binding XRE family transcriptional regulator
MARLQSAIVYRKGREGLDLGLRKFTQALLDGDSETIAQVLEESLAGRCSLADIYSRLITPALASIGEAWCSGKVGVGQEHLATQLILSQLDRLRSMFASHEHRSSYRVLVACVEGEQHLIGARMFADLCLAKGWNVDFLGADVPTPALLDMVKSRRPQLLGLSITLEQGVSHGRRVLGELALLPTPPGVLLAGQAITNDSWPLANNGCTIVRDAIEGVEIAARLQRAASPKTILKEYLLMLGRRVRDLRTKKGWTQEQLAEATRVTRVCIVAVEGGKQNVSMDIVVRMANALGITPEGLFTVANDNAGVSGRQA